jgi:hypothetical protein
MNLLHLYCYNCEIVFLQIARTRFCVLREKICRKGFLKVTGISNGRLYDIRKAVERTYNIGEVRDHGNTNHSGATVRSMKGVEANIWLKDFTDKASDNHAHVREWHLPRMYCKMDIFNHYCTRTTALSRKENSLSYSSFMRMWNEDFPHVKCVKVWYTTS